jgi:hypothetical protein
MKEKLIQFLEAEGQKMANLQPEQKAIPAFRQFDSKSEKDLMNPEVLVEFQKLREAGLIPPTLSCYNYSQARIMVDTKLEPEYYDTGFNFFTGGKMFVQKDERGTLRVLNTNEEVKYFP